MSEIGNFIDGRGLLTKSPFRSWYFLLVTVLCLGSIMIVAYLIYMHWQALGLGAICFLVVFICVQAINQWWRALRYYSRLRKLYAAETDGEAKARSPLDIALRIAAGGITDLLFYSFGTTICSLILIRFLLTRVDGIR